MFIYKQIFFVQPKSIIDLSLKINGQIKPLHYLIKNGDKISHTKHVNKFFFKSLNEFFEKKNLWKFLLQRHEIPVLADEIKIIFEDSDFLVVDKPCSLPMHPCGKYRYNSLSIILAKEMGYSNLRSDIDYAILY